MINGKFRTYDLALQSYHLGKNLKMEWHLRDQFLRALSSVVLNLAEGSGKDTRKDQRKFYVIALGSLREVQAICELGQIKQNEFLKNLDQTAASLFRLIQFYDPV